MNKPKYSILTAYSAKTYNPQESYTITKVVDVCFTKEDVLTLVRNIYTDSAAIVKVLDLETGLFADELLDEV